MNGLKGRGAGFYPGFVLTAAGSVKEIIVVRGQLFSFRSLPSNTLLFLGIAHHAGVKVRAPWHCTSLTSLCVVCIVLRRERLNWRLRMSSSTCTLKGGIDVRVGERLVACGVTPTCPWCSSTTTLRSAQT